MNLTRVLLSLALWVRVMLRRLSGGSRSRFRVVWFVVVDCVLAWGLWVGWMPYGLNALGVVAWYSGFRLCVFFCSDLLLGEEKGLIGVAVVV